MVISANGSILNAAFMIVCPGEGERFHGGGGGGVRIDGIVAKYS